VALYFIETRCFAEEDRSLFLGTLDQLRARLDQLSTLGWMVAAGFELPIEMPTGRNGRRGGLLVG
jgi:hypothetical protein